MPDYVQKKLKKFQHKQPSAPQFLPHQWTKPQFGQKVQLASVPDTTSLLNKKDTKYG